MNIKINPDPFRELEMEILREQSSSLGYSGRKLKESIRRFEKYSRSDASKETMNKLLKDIAENFYNLIIQRELIGFVDSNIYWIKKYYAIPDGSMKFLGVLRTTVH